MSVLSRAELLLQAKNYSGLGEWLDESGNAHHAQLGSAAGADTNDPLFKPWDGETYTYMPGTSVNNVSSADVNLLDADSAHTYQSRGAYPFGAVVDDADSWSGRMNATTYGAGGTTYPFVPSPPGSCEVGKTYTVSGLFKASDWSKVTSVRLAILYRSAALSQLQYVYATQVNNPTEPVRSFATGVATHADTDHAAVLWIVVHTGGFTAYYSDNMVAEGTLTEFVPSVRIVRDLDIEFKAAATDWTPIGTEGIVNRYVLTGDNRCWGIAVRGASGEPHIRTYSNVDGTVANVVLVDCPMGSITNGATYTVRTTMEVGGNATVYVNGVQTGQTSGVAASLFAGNAQMEVGTRYTNMERFDGDIYYVEVRDGIDGPVVARYSAEDAVEPFATQTDAVTGRTWTYNRSASGLVTTVVDRDMFLLTTDDYFRIPDDPALNFDEPDSFTVMAVVRRSITGATAGRFVGKGTAAAWELFHLGTIARFSLFDGTSNPYDDVAASLDLQELLVVAGRRDAVANEIETFVDGVGSGTPSTDTMTATMSNAVPLNIGSRAGTSQWLEGQIIAVALWREALTDAEIAAVGAELTGSGVPQMMLMGVG